LTQVITFLTTSLSAKGEEELLAGQDDTDKEKAQLLESIAKEEVSLSRSTTISSSMPVIESPPSKETRNQSKAKEPVPFVKSSFGASEDQKIDTNDTGPKNSPRAKPYEANVGVFGGVV